MQQIKIFKGVESDTTDLESEVNHWLRESGAKVVQIFGNIAPQTTNPNRQAGQARSFDASDLLMVVVYEA